MKQTFTITGLDIITYGREAMIEEMLDWWMPWSKFPAARLSEKTLYYQDAKVYSVYFDSSTWTGRNG